MSNRNCKECQPGWYCDHHRALARKYNNRRRAIKLVECFRCLSRHMAGERNCPLAAEYDPPPADEAFA